MTDDPIISTREKPGEYDALVSAKPDEPLFTIQGGDPFGPATVLHWAGLARAAGLAEEHRDRSDALLRKAMNAEQVAWRMNEYQAGTGQAEPEAAAAVEPETMLSDERAARIKVAARLQNMVAELGACFDQLEAVGCTDCGLGQDEGEGAMTLLAEARTILRVASEEIEPRTGRERS